MSDYGTPMGSAWKGLYIQKPEVEFTPRYSDRAHLQAVLVDKLCANSFPESDDISEDFTIGMAPGNPLGSESPACYGKGQYPT